MGRYASGVLFLLYAALMAFFVFLIFPDFLGGKFTAFQTTWFVLLSVGLLFFLYAAFRLLSPRRPDILLVTRDRIEYIPGSRPLSGFRRFYRLGIPWGHWIDLDQFVRYDSPATFERRAIDRFELEWINKNVELCAVAYGKKHVIGEFLDWREREWLLEILSRWKSGSLTMQ